MTGSVPPVRALPSKVVKLGGSSFKVKTGTKGKVQVKLTRAGLRLLKRFRTIRAKVSITVTRGSTDAKKTVRVTLKAPPS